MSNTAAANTSAAPRPDLGPQLQQMVNDSSLWVQSHWLQIIIAAAVGTGIVLLLHFLRRLGLKLCERDPKHTGWPTVFGKAIGKTGNFFIIMVAAEAVAGYAAAPAGVMKIVDVLFTLAAVFQAAIWVRELILGFIEHRTGSEGYQGEALINAMGIIRLLVTVVVFAIALIVVLSNLGVNVTGLVAGLGVGGIAIGLAAQGIFSDLFAALAILFDKPFRRGDAVSYDQTSGTVEEIGLKSTRIRSITGEERIISNKQLLDKEIINNTKRDFRRFKFVLGVVCETEVAKLRAIPDMLKAIVESEGYHFVRSGFVNFNASSLDFEIEFDSMTQSFDEGYAARHKVGLAIVERFNGEGIGLAYPTTTNYAAAPDGHLVLPYAEVRDITGSPEEKA
jgi:small-conductance mechanosensitive channel